MFDTQCFEKENKPLFKVTNTGRISVACGEDKKNKTIINVNVK